MDASSRIYLLRYNLPMHTTPLLYQPGTGWCLHRDECRLAAGDHGGQQWAMAGVNEEVWRVYASSSIVERGSGQAWMALALLLELTMSVGDAVCSLDRQRVGPGLAGIVPEQLRCGRV
jgi:hypothetical protein